MMMIIYTLLHVQFFLYLVNNHNNGMQMNKFKLVNNGNVQIKCILIKFILDASWIIMDLKVLIVHI